MNNITKRKKIDLNFLLLMNPFQKQKYPKKLSIIYEKILIINILCNRIQSQLKFKIYQFRIIF